MLNTGGFRRDFSQVDSKIKRERKQVPASIGDGESVAAMADVAGGLVSVAFAFYGKVAPLFLLGELLDGVA